VARPIPEWCLGYQRRIDAAQRDYLLIKEQGEPEEALQGQGETEMSDQNTDLVQEQLSELAQQIVHVIEACNEEKDFLEEEFDWVKNGIAIMESRLQTEKIQINSEIAGVGTMARFQDAVKARTPALGYVGSRAVIEWIMVAWVDSSDCRCRCIGKIIA